MNPTISPIISQTQDTLLAYPPFQKAMAYLEADEENRLEELQRIAIVSGAPFTERKRRSPMYKSMLEKYGASDCAIDQEGNALGFVHGSGEVHLKILLDAHLDTVFSEDTHLEVTERDGRLYCPGIGDDTAALACNLSVLRAIRYADLSPVGGLILSGTVGEEGEGNARGMRFLMRERNDIDAVICVECQDADYLCLEAVGIRRCEFEFFGHGGHSWWDFGIPSPVNAMGRAIAKIADIWAPVSPKTSFNVGVVSGGSTINSIPQKAIMKVDMRSVDPCELAGLAETVESLVAEAVIEENSRWRSDKRVTYDTKIIGERSAGSLPEDSVLAQIGLAAAKKLDIPPQIAGAASTNQNIPISMGIPSVVVGAGGSFRGVHTLEESYSPVGSCKGAQKILLMLFALAGLEGVTEPLAQLRPRQKP